MKPLDRLDQNILRELTLDARQSNVQLAEKVGLSPSPCWQRVRRMETQGLIKGYTAVLNQALLGRAETVLIEISWRCISRPVILIVSSKLLVMARRVTRLF